MLNEIQKNELLKKGFIYLEKLKVSEEKRFSIIEQAKKYSDKKYYNENLPFHNEYLEKFNIKTDLMEDLLSIAKINLNFNCDKEDFYSITRIVGNSIRTENYKFHFDSHLFTLVTPIALPKGEEKPNGELILFPKVRKEPRNEIINFIQKLLYKKYSNYDAYRKLLNKKESIEFNFQDNIPVLFLGRVSLHANHSFKLANNESRITLLTHFFDPSPKYGVGNILRRLRNR